MPARVALALGSGGARGYAHIGVIDELQRRGQQIVSAAGSSTGAVVGMFASGQLDIYTQWVLGPSARRSAFQWSSLRWPSTANADVAVAVSCKASAATSSKRHQVARALIAARQRSGEVASDRTLPRYSDQTGSKPSAGTLPRFAPTARASLPTAPTPTRVSAQRKQARGLAPLIGRRPRRADPLLPRRTPTRRAHHLAQGRLPNRRLPQGG